MEKKVNQTSNINNQLSSEIDEVFLEDTIMTEKEFTDKLSTTVRLFSWSTKYKEYLDEIETSNAKKRQLKSVMNQINEKISTYIRNAEHKDERISHDVNYLKHLQDEMDNAQRERESFFETYINDTFVKTIMTLYTIAMLLWPDNALSKLLEKYYGNLLDDEWKGWVIDKQDIVTNLSLMMEEMHDLEQESGRLERTLLKQTKQSYDQLPKEEDLMKQKIKNFKKYIEEMENKIYINKEKFLKMKNPNELYEYLEQEIFQNFWNEKEATTNWLINILRKQIASYKEVYTPHHEVMKQQEAELKKAKDDYDTFLDRCNISLIQKGIDALQVIDSTALDDAESIETLMDIYTWLTEKIITIRSDCVENVTNIIETDDIIHRSKLNDAVSHLKKTIDQKSTNKIEEFLTRIDNSSLDGAISLNLLQQKFSMLFEKIIFLHHKWGEFGDIPLHQKEASLNDKTTFLIHLLKSKVSAYLTSIDISSIDESESVKEKEKICKDKIQEIENLINFIPRTWFRGEPISVTWNHVFAFYLNPIYEDMWKNHVNHYDEIQNILTDKQKLLEAQTSAHKLEMKISWLNLEVKSTFKKLTQHIKEMSYSINNIPSSSIQWLIKDMYTNTNVMKIIHEISESNIHIKELLEIIRNEEITPTINEDKIHSFKIMTNKHQKKINKIIREFLMMPKVMWLSSNSVIKKLDVLSSISQTVVLYRHKEIELEKFNNKEIYKPRISAGGLGSKGFNASTILNEIHKMIKASNSNNLKDNETLLSNIISFTKEVPHVRNTLDLVRTENWELYFIDLGENDFFDYTLDRSTLSLKSKNIADKVKIIPIESPDWVKILSEITENTSLDQNRILSLLSRKPI